jgi:hypothetical protein
MTIDVYEAELRAAGWSIGDTAVYTPTGVVWMVYGRRGEQRIVIKAPKQSQAWREAANSIRRIRS